MLASNSVGPLVVAFPDHMLPLMDEWIKDDNLWVRRSAILHQLKYGTSTDTERLFRYCTTCMHETDFFARKAIGWALRSYARHDALAVQQFVHDNQEHLSPLSVREALKHVGPLDDDSDAADDAPKRAKRARRGR